MLAEDAGEKHSAAVTSSQAFTVSSCQKWQPRSTKGQKYTHIKHHRALHSYKSTRMGSDTEFMHI